MAMYLRIGTASIRQLPFDFIGNRQRILNAVDDAIDARFNLLLLPELALTGYGCEDNFTFQEFNQLAEASLQELIEQIQTRLHQSPSKVPMLIAVGMPLMFPGGQVYNATAVISEQGLHGFSCKQYLARSGLHYEPRWFEAWERGKVVTHPRFGVPMGDIVIDAQGIRIGFETCEDSWISNRPGRDLYQRNVDVILNPSASHFAVGKYAIREQFIKEGSRAFGVVYAYANLSGTENGTSIFDSGSLIASEGAVVSSGDKLSAKEVLVNGCLVNISANRVNRITSSESIRNDDTNTIKVPVSLALESNQLTAFELSDYCDPSSTPQASFWPELTGQDRDFTEICYAISTGLWDWMVRTKTTGFVVSLSGGADSGLVASLVYFSHVLAFRQLGYDEYLAKLPEKIANGVKPPTDNENAELWLQREIMPHVLLCLYQGSDNSSSTTFNAAQQLALSVGATFHHWQVGPLVQQYTDMVNNLYPDAPLNWHDDDIALQNIQARTRSPGVWLIANRENKLLIATSNLSESALGYATMDGDTSGVISAVSGISKSVIRQLLRWLETDGLPVDADGGSKRIALPQLKWINQQQPTAELRPEEQTDEEDLMPYDICDFIMQCYLVKQMWPRSILVELQMRGFTQTYSLQQLASFIERWFRLFCRNPWKRYGIRAGFHIEQISLDPKTFHRFPLLNSGFSEPLQLMWDYVQQQTSAGN